MLGKNIGRVENVKFYDKNPKIGSKHMLQKLLLEHYTKFKAKDPETTSKNHIQKALSEESYMAYTIDLLAKGGEESAKKATEEQKESINKSLEVSYTTFEGKSKIQLQEVFDTYGVQGLKRNILKKTEEAKNAHKLMFYSFEDYNNDGEAIRVFMK